LDQIVAQVHLVVVLSVDFEFLVVQLVIAVQAYLQVPPVVAPQVVQELSALLLVLPHSFCNLLDIVALHQSLFS
jgi:hypothetical protein